MTYITLREISIPVLALSLGGTILTVLCIVYRRSIASFYFRLRHRWVRLRGRLPVWARVIVRSILGSLGFLLLIGGLVLMPLPGPGSLFVLGGTALLDLEFGWIVPLLELVLERCPNSWKPTALKNGLNKLKQHSASEVR